jgi:hypothetical protein
MKLSNTATELTKTELNLLEKAELRTQETMKQSYFGFIQANITTVKDTGYYSDNFTETIRNVEKTFHFVLTILADYVIINKTAEADGAKGNGRVFKIALGEFETVAV